MVLYKVVVKFWMKAENLAIQVRATEQYSPVMLYIMLYKVVLTLTL